MTSQVESNLYTGKARLRPRDIRLALSGKNIDPVVIQTLETMAEQDGTLRRQIEMLADIVNKFTDHVLVLQQVVGAISDRVPNIENINAAKVLKDEALNRIKVHGEDEAETR